MLGLDKIIDLEPFSLEESEKNKIFSKALIDLTKYHYNNCSKYKKIINLLEFSFKKKHSKEDMPFIPVNLFKDYDLMSVKRKEVFKILTSSGTTGTKKLVRQSYQNYISNTKSIVNKLKNNSSISTITTLPISYTFGLSIINSHLYSGSTIILNDNSVLQKGFWEKYNKHKPKSIYGVPYTYELLSKIGISKVNHDRLKIIAHAGGRLNKNLFLEISKFSEKNQIKFFSMYGQAEATARMSILDYKYSLTKIKSIGKPISGGKFIIKNDKKKIINTFNKPGELFYYGDNVCLGYAKSYLDLKKGDENQKIINTGDIALFDKDKFYFIVGRKKRIIKIFGNRVSLDEIEMIIEKMGYKVICKNVDDKLCINYIDKNLNEFLLKKELFKLLKINPKFIDLKRLEKFNINTSGKIIF